ncbi:MFS transporter, partial [Yersinia pestis]|uniref:MFS transporter n=2 Tax=Yersinia pestis TaxID=632 RepID=UPI0005788B0B
FVPPPAGIYVISALADKTGKRRLLIMISLFCFAAALVASVIFRHNVLVSYLALVVCGFFLKAATSPFWSIPGRIAVPEVAGGARGGINGLGNLGGFCGPYLVGVMIFFYGQSAAVCMLAGSLIIAGLITLTLPKECDVEVKSTGKAIADNGLTKAKRA